MVVPPTSKGQAVHPFNRGESFLTPETACNPKSYVPPRISASVQYREEVLNYILAEILRSYGLTANPEIIEKGRMPDVIILVGGIKVILEGKLAGTGRALKKQAKERLRSGLADISVGVIYPEGANLAESVDELRSGLESSRYDGYVFHWGSEGILEEVFEDKAIQELVSLLNRVYKLYVRNDILRGKIEDIERIIGNLEGRAQQTSLFFQGTLVEKRLREALGLGDGIGKEEEE